LPRKVWSRSRAGSGQGARDKGTLQARELSPAPTSAASTSPSSGDATGSAKPLSKRRGHRGPGEMGLQAELAEDSVDLREGRAPMRPSCRVPFREDCD